MNMKLSMPNLRGPLVCLLLAVFSLGAVAHATAGDIKLDALLIWGTNDDAAPDPKLKPVSEGVAKKLACFKFTHYYEVNRKQFTLPESGAAKTRLSKDCEVSVKKLEKNQVEVTLIGKGQPAGTIKQELKKGKSIVAGGNAANSTAWFVILKQVD
jgi:hypothetical protein